MALPVTPRLIKAKLMAARDYFTLKERYKIQESIRMTLGLEELDNVAKLMDTVANPKD